MKRLFLAALALASASSFAAVSITASPSSQSVSAGSSVTVDINIAGLGGGTALGTFDIDLGFDPAVLSYASTSFGNQLDLFGLGDLQSATLGAGKVNLFELSLESIADLNSLQASAFKLATVTFTAIGAGTDSALSLTANALGDAEGASISAPLTGVTVTVTSAVPEPAAYVLMVAGLAGLAAMRRASKAC